MSLQRLGTSFLDMYSVRFTMAIGTIPGEAVRPMNLQSQNGIVSKQPHFKYAAVSIKKADETIIDKIGNAVETVKDTLKPQEA